MTRLMTSNPAFDGLPPSLAASATVLAGEPAWPPDDAREAVRALATADAAIVGVELWREVGGAPEWRASSAYECGPAGGWDDYVNACAREADAFITRFQGEPGALFSLTWASARADQ
jgi:hypothetical protein